jgi:hypothetical protein
MPQPESDRIPPPSERRSMVRYPAKSSTLVICESDMMRCGIEARLRNVSATGLGVVTSSPLKPEESVKIVLANEIQRIRKETRGVVRHVTQRDDDTYQVGIELLLRLTPLEVSLLRMGIPRPADENTRKWV